MFDWLKGKKEWQGTTELFPATIRNRRESSHRNFRIKK